MAGVHKKGTTDADGNGKMGGSLPESDTRLARVERELASLKALMRANGWSLPKED